MHLMTTSQKQRAMIWCVVVVVLFLNSISQQDHPVWSKLRVFVFSVTQLIWVAAVEVNLDHFFPMKCASCCGIWVLVETSWNPQVSNVNFFIPVTVICVRTSGTCHQYNAECSAMVLPNNTVMVSSPLSLRVRECCWVFRAYWHLGILSMKCLIHIYIVQDTVTTKHDVLLWCN